MASAPEDGVGDVEKDRMRSKSVDSRGSSISSEVDSEVQKETRRRSKESTISEEKPVCERISKAIEEEDAFLVYIKSLPAMSSDKVEAYKKSQSLVYKRSTSEASGGLEHLDNLYRLMEHLGQLRLQNNKLQERVKYLEHIAQEDVYVPHKIDHETEVEDVKHSRNKRSTKCKSSHYGIRHPFLKSSRERSRSVGVEEITKSTGHYRLLGTQDFDPRGPGSIKAKVSKWTKVKEAFRWEKASNGVLPEAKSQDSGLGATDDVRYLRVPHAPSDHSSSFSVSPADSVLSGQSLGQPKDCLSMPHIPSSASTSDEDIEDNHFAVDSDIPTCSFRREGIDPRRSKSLDGVPHSVPCEIQVNNDTGKDQKHTHPSQKGLKTPWGKMKDMIQTRSVSIKKKKEDSDVEEDNSTGALIEDCGYDHSQNDFERASEGPGVEGEAADSCGKGYDRSAKRRLAPMLTITLPSTEELHSGPESRVPAKVAAKPPPSPQTDERHLKAAIRSRCHEDLIDSGGQTTPRKISGGSAGTSPPNHRKLSKWSKVKNAFLTSASASEDCLMRGSSSVPSSPVKAASFTYDIESDELSSGEFIDDNLRDDDVFPETIEDICDLTKHQTVHAEIQRNYEELQLKLSQEFHKKLCEWERKKSAGSPGTPPCSSKVAGSGFSSGTSSIADDSPHDKVFRKKMEEWEKMKSSSGVAKHRESVTLQNFSEDNLSAEFKKKLEEWEKIKSVPSPQSPDIVNSPQPHFKKKITDWQLWKPGVIVSKSDAGISGMASPPADLPEDFYKKLQEWERLKQYGTHPSSESPGNKTPSPNTSRRDCTEHKTGKLQQSPTGKKERDFGFQIRVQKSKSHHEVKELAWLEKELHKIEREKLRLERERDKYLEREARLEKLRRAIGANIKKQEIVIPTSTGLFRFEGISQKFTRKLYEWEKARGIGPEASTFALLEPGYQPPRPSSDIHGQEGVSNGSLLTRSKSMGSVVDLAALVGNQNSLTHQPSSLSLTHMEKLENSQLSSALRGSDELCTDEPQAMIVDVVDEIEETASPLEHTPAVQSQTPIYCYAPEEVTRLIDSSGSDSDKDVMRLGQAQSSIDLIHENMQLLDSLQRKEDVCRELVGKVDDVEDALYEADKIHKEHLGNLVKDSYEELSEKCPALKQNKEDIKEKLLRLESQQERLIEEATALQNSFIDHSEQQARTAQDLVHNVKRLQDNIMTTKTSGQDLAETSAQSQQLDRLRQVKELTSELLSLAEKLEVTVSERNLEMSMLRRVVGNHGRGRGLQRLRTSHHWFSTDSVSSMAATGPLVSQTSGDFSPLPMLVTSKLQELKELLSTVISDNEMKIQSQSPLKTKLSIVNPESPEVETTFVFNIGKKNKKQPDIAQVCDLEVPNSGKTNEEDYKEDWSRAEASFSFSQSRKLSSSTSNTCAFQLDEATSSRMITESGCDRLSLEESEEKREKNSIESVVELTYPLKTYFHEDCKAPQLRRASVHSSRSSCCSDSDSNTTKKLKHNDDAERCGYELMRETTATKKYKRNRLSSGPLERRRSRTSSKNENTDDDEEGSTRVFEPSTSKKPVNNDMKYKKQSKSKHKSNDYTGKKGHRSGCDAVNTTSKITPVENDNEESVGNIKPLSSPKCASKRAKKVHQSSKDDNGWNGNSCMSYNYCCKRQTDEAPLSQGMTVNVFVPTTRTIFSPVRKDSKDETSTVISYVVEEPDPSCVSFHEESSSNTNTYVVDNNKNENHEESSSCNERDCETIQEVDLTNAQIMEKKEESKPKFDFVMPPCWIIKQARAQSASPALQRKTVTQSVSKDTIQEKDVPHTVAEGQRDHFNKPRTHKNGVDSKEDCANKTKPVKENDIDSRSPDKQSSTDMSTPKDNSKKNSSSSESVENSRLLRKEGSAIPSSLKLRSEAGFPPISPLSVRREMKVMKETAPSIRMMIAKYNQRVHETHELSGTKSPDSGAQSPIAWRSPVAERRINVQMEKYQEEVRRAFQKNSKKEFYPHAKLGQVQKSASAGYIRPFEKGCSTDSINSRGGKFSEQPLQCHGILKSSSAGAIKTVSPPPVKRHEKNSSDINVCVVSPSPASNTRKEMKPIRLEIRSGDNISQAIRVNVSSVVSDCKRATTLESSTSSQIPNDCEDYNRGSLQQENINSSTKVRALKIKKAKEEFLLRGCVGEKSGVDRPGTTISTTTPETAIHNERLLWEGSKTRLSQISCDSESSYENVPMILVSGKELPRDSDGVLLVKSASVGMINMDSTACSTLFCGTSNSPENRQQNANPKSKSGILSRFRRARLKKNKEKESKLETVSTLCMQSLVVDINKNNQASSESIPSTSKSCPSSPVLHKKDQSAKSWIRNPKKIFKPKL